MGDRLEVGLLFAEDEKEEVDESARLISGMMAVRAVAASKSFE